MELVNFTNITNTLPNQVLETLLLDQTTGKHILNTIDYTSYDIIPELIPRCLRLKEVNEKRTKHKAEVFTPIWVVEKMNKMVLDDCLKTPFDEYMDSTQLEITCGEGVFLTTRYDSETGELISLSDRVGLLDAKLKRLCEENFSKALFEQYLVRITKSIYGYEYQGDSLLMARINVLSSIQDFYYSIFNQSMNESLLCDLAKIISWNIFQMDGLTNCVPQKDVIKTKKKEYMAVNGIPVKVMNWKEGKIENFSEPHIQRS